MAIDRVITNFIFFEYFMFKTLFIMVIAKQSLSRMDTFRIFLLVSMGPIAVRMKFMYIYRKHI